MKTILLLGGYGFIGTNILSYIDRFLFDDYKVIVFDKFPKHISGKSFKSVNKTYVGDFSDSSVLKNIFDENQIDLVIHSLSTTIPSNSFNAQYDIESNLIPTIELLNQMIQHHIYDIVYISSGGAVYGTKDQVNHRENEDVYPISSYGVIKLTIEKYLMQYSQLYSLRPLILRLSNPYGPYHYSMKQGVCNVALSSAIQKEDFVVWGDGKACKDYIYITDFVTILFKLLSKNINNEVINIASGKIVSVNEILYIIKTIVPDFNWEYQSASCLDVTNFRLDTTKLESFIGVYDFVGIEEGLNLTYNWIKKND